MNKFCSSDANIRLINGGSSAIINTSIKRRDLTFNGSLSVRKEWSHTKQIRTHQESGFWGTNDLIEKARIELDMVVQLHVPILLEEEQFVVRVQQWFMNGTVSSDDIFIGGIPRMKFMYWDTFVEALFGTTSYEIRLDEKQMCKGIYIIGLKS